MRIPFILVPLLAYSASAGAINPPIGWTATGEHTAVRDPRHPEQGELREFLVGGGTGDPDELEFILRGVGLAPASIQAQPSGAVELVFEDRLARARFRQDPEQPSWLVLFTSADGSSDLDADAVLVSMLPVPAGIGNGLVSPTPLDAGMDGNPWGDAPSAETTQEGWWASNDPSSAWSHDSAIVGLWEGTALKRGNPARMKLRLEADGVLVLEMRSSGRAEVSEGEWASRDGSIRLDLGESRVIVSSYDVVGTTLKLRHEGVAYDLVLLK